MTMDATANPIVVSLIVPILNEERYIEDCVRTLQKQDFFQNPVQGGANAPTVSGRT